MIIAFLIVRDFFRPPGGFIRYAFRTEGITSNNCPSSHVSAFKTWVLDFIGTAWFKNRLDIGGDNSVSRLGFMVHEEGIRKDYPPIRSCIIDDLNIQVLPQIFGKIRLILHHVGKPHALLWIWEVNIGESAVAVSGNYLSGIGSYNINIYFVIVFPTAKLETNPTAAAQLEGAGTKHTGCRFRVLPTV
ncbi:hypothetical protein D3C81_604090 [compost metagenome]